MNSSGTARSLYYMSRYTLPRPGHKALKINLCTRAAAQLINGSRKLYCMLFVSNVFSLALNRCHVNKKTGP
jgi:hypothetical protein